MGCFIMNYKKYLARVGRWLLHGIPIVNTKAEIVQINYGSVLDNKNIIVTGGGRGLGFYIAQKCANEGANVLIVGRNKETLKQASQKIGCKYIVFDIEKTEEINLFFLQCMQLFCGKIDAIVNNAGVSLHEGDLRNVTIEGFDKQIDINLKGSYFLSKYYIEEYILKKKKPGNIVFISSERGNQCDDIPYGLTKAAINSLVRGLSRRCYKAGLRVNGVAPGVTASDMTGYSANDNITRNDSASGRVFLPEEVAEVVCFLLSDASKCISGEVINCDAGEYLNPWWKESFSFDSNMVE